MIKYSLPLGMELMPRKNSFFYSFENTPLKEVDRVQKKRIDYYPFGLEHQKAENTARSSNLGQQYKFGGKEYQPELGLDWYDVSARNYDPALGRWMNIDPLADFMKSESPYEYAFNNPIYYIDTDGRMPYGSDHLKQDVFQRVQQDTNCPDCANKIDLDEIVLTPGDQTIINVVYNKLDRYKGYFNFALHIYGPSGTHSDASVSNIFNHKPGRRNPVEITGSETLRDLNSTADQLINKINNKNVVPPKKTSMDNKPDPNEPVAPGINYLYTTGVNATDSSLGSGKGNIDTIPKQFESFNKAFEAGRKLEADGVFVQGTSKIDTIFNQMNNEKN